MKFTILQKNFKQNLDVVGNAINSRTPLPVLSNILIKTEKGRIKLVASDLQVTIATYVGAKIDEDGEITIPAKLLSEFVNQLVDEKITGELESNSLQLTTNKVKAVFSGIPANEFPEVVDIKDSSTKIVLDANKFLESIHKVYFASATDEGRPVLTGVYLKVKGNSLILASTDGFRMSEYKLSLSKPIKNEFECIVPARIFSTVLKSFLGYVSVETLDLYFNADKNMLSIVVDDMEASFRTIEGEYPDYQSVIPKDFDTTISIEKSEFSNAIKLANVFAKDTGYSVKLVVKDKKVTLASQPTESGTNLVNIDCKVRGDDVTISFNAKYLLDFVNNSDATDLEFKIADSLKPGMLTEKGDDNYWYIVMPMKSTW